MLTYIVMNNLNKQEKWSNKNKEKKAIKYKNQELHYLRAPSRSNSWGNRSNKKRPAVTREEVDFTGDLTKKFPH